MRNQIVDELSVGAPPERVAQAKKLVPRGGNIAAQLVEAGFAPRDVLQACCAVTGVPPAPLGWLRDPKPPAVDGLDVKVLRRVVAAPVALQNGKLCIAYADPEMAVRSEELGLPKHQAYLALAADLQKALSLLPTQPPVDDDSALFDDVPPDDDDGATIVNRPVALGEDHGTSDASAGAADSDDDDDALFDDQTASLAVPPSAPKPARRQQSGAVIAASHDTLVNAPTQLGKQPVAPPPPPNLEEVATSTMKRKSPSLATPAHGSMPSMAMEPQETVRLPARKAEHIGLKNAAAVPARAKEPSRDAAPPAQPAREVSSSAPRPPRETPAPRTVKDGASQKGSAVKESAKASVAKEVAPPKASVPQDASRPSRSGRDGSSGAPPKRAAAAPAATVETAFRGSESTKQNALAALSADDLVDDNGEADALPPPQDEPSSPTVDGTRAVSAVRSSQAPDTEGAFSSAESAPDQEVVSNQKQRLKRIAQIASIKRYKIDRVLGRGGMATVYFATDTKTNTACALKLMEPHLADDAVFVERFKREIRASVALNHENIVRVFDYGEEGGNYYMASEYVDGGTVGSLLKSVDRPLPVCAAVPIMIGFLDGLEAAHAQGFVHRDLKPANLMLTKKGVIKIGDFGIAKAQTDSTLTKTGALFGTPAYMSPEQAQGQELDTRSDLFGVGIIFYELLAGYNPYAHENPSTTMFAIAKGQARPLFDANPTVPEVVERVVQKLLEKDLKKRYQTAGQARDDLHIIGEMLAEKYDNPVQMSLKEPTTAVEALLKAQSTLESERATKLLGRQPPEHAEAAFRYYKATLLDPQNYEAVNGLTQLRADYGFRFTRPDDKQMLELEQSLEKKPDQPAVLRRLADLSATHRNLVDMAGFMKRYLRFFANDTHVQHKLERIVGTDPFAPFSILPAEVPNAEQGWQADDQMLDAARAAADEDAAAAAAGNKSAVRPAARVNRQSNPNMQAAPSRQPATPATAHAAVSGSDSGSGSRRAQESRQQALAHAKGGEAPNVVVEQPDLPPARDSLEFILRSARGFVEDALRSLTGDQGFKAVREAFADRFGGDARGELKDVVKGALGKGKEVVADSLLKQEGRKLLKEGFAVQLKRHWRLGALILGCWVLLIGLGKACSLACGASPPPQKKPAEMRGVNIDDGLSAPAAAEKKDAKSDKKKKGAKDKDPPKLEDKAPTIEPDKPAARTLSPEEESRLLGDKAPPPPVILDAKAQLAAQQEELKAKAKAEPDTKKAIEMYTRAIDVDPYAAGARDALLARARLHQGIGELDKAEADLFRLKRRVDVTDVQSDVDQMLAEIAKTRKAQTPPEPPPQ